MLDSNPLLYSLSTVCLLKHYNQDYLLHTLRTDFTGSNGVGKSIIADLFQIVFIADSKHIKFATDGIDKKKRKIETLPYESGIGYVFFNVEVTKGNFVTIGAAMLAQGNNVVKPFIVTSSISLDQDRLEQNTFAAENLLYSRHFLKANNEPYTLDELARVAPERYNLYVHAFNNREERNFYYDWLYKNDLLSINLVKEGNLKAFAKVIQSFSKSKSLDIDSSKSLIEYLFEEDEKEIEEEYRQQEQAIQKLLHQFKATKYQINDIDGKQADLLRLKKLEDEKNEAGYALDFASYVVADKDRIKKKSDFDKIDREIHSKESRLGKLTPRSERFTRLVNTASSVSQREDKAFGNLAENQATFSKLKELQDDEKRLNSISTNGMMRETPEFLSQLLEKEARHYIDAIQNSTDVLKRYSSVKSMEERRDMQQRWLKEKLREIENHENQLTEFRYLLEKVDENSLFVKTFSTYGALTKPQQAALIYLRTVLLSKPNHAKEGMRYTESTDLIRELEIIEDKDNSGWWIKGDKMYEFIPETLSILPNFSDVHFDDKEQLKTFIALQLQELQKQKIVYDNLSNGIIPEEFSEYEFDGDISDNTKVSAHRVAAQYCALIAEKINLLRKLQNEEIEKIRKAKQEYGIGFEGIEYEALLAETKTRKELFKRRLEKLKGLFDTEQTEIATIKSSLPLLNENHKRLSEELADAQDRFAEVKKNYQHKYPTNPLPNEDFPIKSTTELEYIYQDKGANYRNEYNQIMGKYEETKDHRDIRVDEQVSNQNFSFDILEQALLGPKIRTLDAIIDHMENLNTELLAIADELLKSLVKVFGKTENYFDRYKSMVQDLNDFFWGKLISERFYFRIDFNAAPKLDIKWIEQLRKSAHGIASGETTNELSPEKFIEDFYMKFSGNRSRISVEELLNPKRYFVLRGKLMDENNKETSGSTGESYAAIALLGIARLSVVQDGERAGLRFIILEESATLDNVNFKMFPVIAEKYGYQIITMTPKPYAIGGDEGWFIHHLIPGKENKDINYHKVMSYFRTNKSQMELSSYLNARQ